MERFLGAYQMKSFSTAKFTELFDTQWKSWGVKRQEDYLSFIEGALAARVLLVVQLIKDDKQKNIITHRHRDVLTTLNALSEKGYFAYLTAMELHQLCNKTNYKSIYLNTEHTKDQGEQSEGNGLTQDKIDETFEGLQRISNNVWNWGRREVMLTNGKKTGQLGMVSVESEDSSYRYTDLERTLIDIVVRPAYAGGPAAVLKAFRRARTRLRAEVLAEYLAELNYIYPYHQNVGFYMERAGYPKRDWIKFDRPKKFDFYLAHHMPFPVYDEKWRIYAPDDIVGIS